MTTCDYVMFLMHSLWPRKDKNWVSSTGILIVLAFMLSKKLMANGIVLKLSYIPRKVIHSQMTFCLFSLIRM